MSKKAACLLVDLQNDYLRVPGLVPAAAQLLEQTRRLLSGLRHRGIPVVRVHTVIKADGSNRMPHWKRRGYQACVEGTEGCLPPAGVAPHDRELILEKQFYSAFDGPDLQEALRGWGTDTLIVAGLYTHACVRASVLDAYARGYTVWVAAEAVASPEPLHAGLSQGWLEGRAARFLRTPEILEALGPDSPPAPAVGAHGNPAGLVDGEWVTGPVAGYRDLYNPMDAGEVLSRVPLADGSLIDRAARGVNRAREAWAEQYARASPGVLGAWAGELEKRREELIRLLIREIGKPRVDAEEEMGRALSHLRATLKALADRSAVEHSGPFRVRHRPVGCLALITPWNNPLAIPVAKLAAALAFGNTLLWKPALPAPLVSRAVLNTLLEAGLPPPVVAMVFGDGSTGREVMAHPAVDAVSLTGSSSTGRAAARLCGRLGKPLQAEMGGNNGAIVMADVDLDQTIPSLVSAGFGFAGQRCTATRRVIVDTAIWDRFLPRLVRAVNALPVGDPADPATRVGPLLSRGHRNNVLAVVREAVAGGGTVLCGGGIAPSLARGNGCQPTLIADVAAESAIVQEETFGPVMVIQRADDFQEALGLCNGVPQGLVASLYSREPSRQSRFMELAQAGVLRINPTVFPVHPDAPFGGWKASGLGPPEHGPWDRAFYSRPQVVYAAEAAGKDRDGDASGR